MPMDRSSLGEPGALLERGYELERIGAMLRGVGRRTGSAMVVEDLQWCYRSSVRALAFIARRLEGQPLGLLLATRPLDPGLTSEAAALAADPGVEVMRPLPLTEGAVGALVATRLFDAPVG